MDELDTSEEVLTMAITGFETDDDTVDTAENDAEDVDSTVEEAFDDGAGPT
jgi:hypothetical protein